MLYIYCVSLSWVITHHTVPRPWKNPVGIWYGFREDSFHLLYIGRTTIYEKNGCRLGALIRCSGISPYFENDLFFFIRKASIRPRSLSETQKILIFWKKTVVNQQSCLFFLSSIFIIYLFNGSYFLSNIMILHYSFLRAIWKL